MGKKRKKMRATVEKIIKPVSPMEPEKAQITIPDADDLYREVRVENVLTDESGEKAGLKPGADLPPDWACLTGGAVKIPEGSLLCHWGEVSNGQEEEKDAGYGREDHRAC